MVALTNNHNNYSNYSNNNNKRWTTKYIGLWLLPLLLLLLTLMQQPCEGRYLPTRSHGDDLDKLRELMLQILESSNEEQQRPPNEANGNTLAQRASWLNKLNAMDGLEAPPRKYGSRGIYENGRYY